MSKTILIIEDEISIQNIVQAFLEDAGYTVFCAGDGLEGIETFRRCNPDLVLLDLMLNRIYAKTRILKNLIALCRWLLCIEFCQKPLCYLSR